MTIKKKNFIHGPIQVAMFGRYYPNYRLGVLNNISKMENIDLSVYASLKPIEGFSPIEPSEARFSLLNTAVWHLRIPFTQKSVDFMPYSIWSVLVGKYDVFVMSDRMTELSAWVNLALGRLIGRRVCLWGHGITKRDSPRSAKLRKLMMRLAYANILYSDSGKKKAIEMGLGTDKLFVAYNALDTRRSQAIREGISADDLKRFRKENNLCGRKIIFFSGRLQKRKKLEVFIRAMQTVTRQAPDALAVIIGDGVMRKKLERLIKDLEMESHVRLLGGVFDEEIMAKYLLSSSMVVMSAAGGLAIQHAFGYGVPIVIGDDMSSHGPEIELVKNGETGIFCEDGNILEFAEAIIGLLNDEGKRQHMSVACRCLIENKYNVGNMAKGIIDAVTYAANMKGETT